MFINKSFFNKVVMSLAISAVSSTIQSASASLENVASQPDVFRSCIMSRLDVSSVLNLRKTSSTLKTAVDSTPSWIRFKELAGQTDSHIFVCTGEGRYSIRRFAAGPDGNALVEMPYTALEKYQIFRGMFARPLKPILHLFQNSANSHYLENLFQDSATSHYLEYLAPMNVSVEIYKMVSNLGMGLGLDPYSPWKCGKIIKSLSKTDVCAVERVLSSMKMLIDQTPSSNILDQLSDLGVFAENICLQDAIELPEMVGLYIQTFKAVKNPPYVAGFLFSVSKVAPVHRERFVSIVGELTENGPIFDLVAESMCLYDMRAIEEINSRGGDFIKYICSTCVHDSEKIYGFLFDAIRKFDRERFSATCAQVKKIMARRTSHITPTAASVFNLFLTVADLPDDRRAAFCELAKVEGDFLDQVINYLRAYRRDA